MAGDEPDRPVWTKEFAGKTVDADQLIDLTGQSFVPAEDRPAMLIHFWATWCAPCLEELPRLERISKRMGKKLAVVAVSEDRGGAEDVTPFLAEHPGLSTLNVLWDRGRKTARKLGVSILPTTVLFKNGVEVSRVTGPAGWDEDDLRRLSDDVGD